MSVLNTKVSFFIRCTHKAKPVTVNLLTYLLTDKYKVVVGRIRAIDNKAQRDRMKKALLPGITASGIFSRRAEEYLLNHSGLIALDIDPKDNVFSMAKIKQLVIALPYVAYCGLSASGRGLWVLVPIAFPERHTAHFAALVEDFARLGIVLDPAPANVASFRFCSYDPGAWFNHTAMAYTKVSEQQPEAYKSESNRARYVGDESEKLETIVQRIEAGSRDITGNYRQWFALLSSLATLGEAGRDYAHRISRFYPKYTRRETNRQFTACLHMKNNSFSLGTLFKTAKDHGVQFRE